MKLWLIEAIRKEYDFEQRKYVGGLPPGDDPWEEPWDKYFSFLIRAETENEARIIAQSRAADEDGQHHDDPTPAWANIAWLSAKYSTCVELTPDGESGVVMSDFNAGQPGPRYSPSLVSSHSMSIAKRWNSHIMALQPLQAPNDARRTRGIARPIPAAWQAG